MVEGNSGGTEREEEAASSAVDTAGEVKTITLDDMLLRLEHLTGEEFASSQQSYETFVASAEIAAINSDFVLGLSDLYEGLQNEYELGKIRGVETWADGTDSFKLVRKSWASYIDKIYRIDEEENSSKGSPPQIRSNRAVAQNLPNSETWVTPRNAADYLDDLIRTKFVVPFVDGVQPITDAIKMLATSHGLTCYRRYHAKDSGYHAHHVYILIPVPALDGTEREVVLEVKILTKMQDTLGELTHLLYELKRTGQIKSEKKRKLAWLFESPDFTASYLGHTAHCLESAISKLKNELRSLEDVTNGKP